MRIGLYQCEIGLPHNAPHLGAALVASDLQRAGHSLDLALVALSHIDELCARVAAGGFDLIGVDAIFPAPAVDRIRSAAGGAPVVIGGINSLGSFLASSADYAIVGQGRDAAVALAATLARGGAPADLASVPNLFWRVGAARIEASPVVAPAALAREIESFDPDFDWDYIGPARAPNANHHRLSIIAELGCPYMPDAGDAPLYAAVRPAEAGPYDLGATARERITKEFAHDRRGCTFCVFRYQPYTSVSTQATVENLLAQYRALVARYGIHEVWLQSEAPLRFLEPFLHAVEAAALALTEVTVRAFPAHLLSKRERFFAALDLATRMQVKISLTEIGFENHSASELELFNKGTTPADNVALDELLAAARQRYGAFFEGHQGHGIILLTPWTTFADLEANLAAARRMPYLTRGLTAESRLTLYNEYVPIAARAAQEGLLVRGAGNFGLDFRYRDPRIGEFAGVLTAYERILNSIGLSDSIPARVTAFEVSLAIAREPAAPEAKRRSFVSGVRRLRALAGLLDDDAAPGQDRSA